MSRETWSESEPWGDKLGQPVEPDSHAQKEVGQEMEPAAERAGHGLGLEMVIKGGGVTPDDIAANLDQTRAQHDPEDKPSKQDDDEHWRSAFWKGAGVYQGAEENGEEPGLKQLDLPAVA